MTDHQSRARELLDIVEKAVAIGKDEWRNRYALVETPKGHIHKADCDAITALPNIAAELRAALERETALMADVERLKPLLAHAVNKADGWHDDSYGGPIEGDPLMDEARRAVTITRRTT